MDSPVVPSGGVLTPLGVSSVRLNPGFWASLPTETIIDHCHEWIGRVGWAANFTGAPRRGREFSDSEVYKLMEAMAWTHDPRLDELTSVIAGAQEPDGYLNTKWGHARYSDLEWGHELYCYGHLIQAGVAQARASGGGELFELVKRAADHVCHMFMNGRGVCGHPEIEMALIELYRVTRAERYLEMARRFIDRRGTPALADIELGRAYFQDDVPVRKAEVFRGHVVRALYLACAVVDLAVETNDRDLLDLVERQWERTVARRTHLTGGMGSRHNGESFGEDWELPPDRAYNETCAGVASFMLSHRLLLATGNRRYADLAERTFYNVVAAGPALDGRSFFYTNPLQVRVAGEVTSGVSPRADGGLRASWRSVSCCPTNLARTFAALPAYVATGTDAGLQIHHLTAARVEHDGFAVEVDTEMPWQGAATLRVLRAPDRLRVLSLRLPTWAGGGTAEWSRVWTPGEEVSVDLRMTPRWVEPDPRIDALRGCVAVERGPLVYCAESPADQPPLTRITVDTSRAPEVVDEEIEVSACVDSAEDRPWPYGPPARTETEPIRLRLRPYHQWGNHGPATMRVWLPQG
ncbi:glycoside hydrolase family 127 protein [Herbidospora galbida]|uniref:Glycoside hydrolase family 127 protein n=1 Tax=Herbidospora galbida TaxID=2575442 RepID=A0A4U3MEU2_9ACTN|nr:beta-L-arabinofuranosidase domain-containing protein [Herbidospora galbida]TKK86256.1 glycoside hydrolase family 127 protein [Herbidospora galbida]